MDISLQQNLAVQQDFDFQKVAVNPVSDDFSNEKKLDGVDDFAVQLEKSIRESDETADENFTQFDDIQFDDKIALIDDEILVPEIEENRLFIDAKSVLKKIGKKEDFSLDKEKFDDDSFSLEMKKSTKKTDKEQKNEVEAAFFENVPFEKFQIDEKTGEISVSTDETSAVLMNETPDFGKNFDAGFEKAFGAEKDEISDFDEDFSEFFEVDSSDLRPFEERIFVVDERTKKIDEIRAENNKTERDVFKKEIQVDENGNARMTLTLADDSKPANLQNSAEPVAAKNFSSMLSEQIRADANAFVQAGMISLKDGNHGKIDLVLRPENLGNVKISLNLSDKILTGKIVVATEAAYNAFRDSMDSLKAAFNANGFDTQSFDLAWSGAQQGGQHAQEQAEKSFGKPGFFYSANSVFESDVLDSRAVRRMHSLHVGARLDKLA